jgi:hypothetical protein
VSLFEVDGCVVDGYDDVADEFDDDGGDDGRLFRLKMKKKYICT